MRSEKGATCNIKIIFLNSAMRMGFLAVRNEICRLNGL